MFPSFTRGQLTNLRFQIRWNITVADVEAWIPPAVPRISPEDQPLSIHILCNRFVSFLEILDSLLNSGCTSADGKTLNQLYIELSTLQAAQTLVRLKNDRPLAGRLVAVGLSTFEELMEHIFPTWIERDTKRLIEEENLIAQEDLDGLIKLCRLEVSPRHPSLVLYPSLRLCD